MIKYIERKPPEYNGDPEKSICEIIDYLEYLRVNLNWILDNYGKRLVQETPLPNNATVTQEGGGE